MYLFSISLKCQSDPNFSKKSEEGLLTPALVLEAFLFAD